MRGYTPPQSHSDLTTFSDSARPRRRPRLHLDAQYEYYLPTYAKYRRASAPCSTSAGPSLPPLSPLDSPLLSQAMLDLDELELPHDAGDKEGDPYTPEFDATTPGTTPPRDTQDKQDKSRLMEIAQVIARSGGASESEILEFLLSESDEEEPQEVRQPEALESRSDSESSESEMEVDEEDDDDDDQELRTLYRYMNPGKYGNVDLAHPLCSPIDDMFGNKKPTAAYFDDEDEALF